MDPESLLQKIASSKVHGRRAGGIARAYIELSGHGRVVDSQSVLILLDCTCKKESIVPLQQPCHLFLHVPCIIFADRKAIQTDGPTGRIARSFDLRGDLESKKYA